MCTCAHRVDGHFRWSKYCQVCRVCGLNKTDCRGRGHTYRRCACNGFEVAA